MVPDEFCRYPDVFLPPDGMNYPGEHSGYASKMSFVTFSTPIQVQIKSSLVSKQSRGYIRYFAIYQNAHNFILLESNLSQILISKYISQILYMAKIVSLMSKEIIYIKKMIRRK